MAAAVLILFRDYGCGIRGGVLTGLATTIIAIDADVVTLVPAVIVYVLGAIFVIRCVASMKHAAAASTG